MVLQDLAASLAIEYSDTVDPDYAIEPAPNDVPELNFGSGVDQHQNASKEELQDALGGKQCVDSLVQWLDGDGLYDEWTPEGEQYLHDTQNRNGIVPFEPKWHQWVAVLKMVLNAFEGHPVLLMDGVGVGKTLQVIMLFCVLRWLRAFYGKHGHFPGKLSTWICLCFCIYSLQFA